MEEANAIEEVGGFGDVRKLMNRIQQSLANGEIDQKGASEALKFGLSNLKQGAADEQAIRIQEAKNRGSFRAGGFAATTQTKGGIEETKLEQSGQNLRTWMEGKTSTEIANIRKTTVLKAQELTNEGKINLQGLTHRQNKEIETLRNTYSKEAAKESRIHEINKSNIEREFIGEENKKKRDHTFKIEEKRHKNKIEILKNRATLIHVSGITDPTILRQ